MLNRCWKVLGSVVALSLAAWVALYSPPAGAQEILRQPADPEAWQPRSVFGNAVLLGGGFGNFTDDAARDVTGAAGGWGLRYVAGTRSVIGGEISYTGAANSIDGTTIGDDYLLSSSFDANLRGGWPIPMGSTLLSPFAYIGAGWTRYDLINEVPTGILASDTDNQFTIPMGAGFAVGYRGFMAETRITYRPAFSEDLFGDTDMDTWGMTFSLGGEF
jgi:hypothetical protein